MTNIIEKYPVTLIFKKILAENLSGELVVGDEDENVLKKLYFSKGELQFASSNLVRERLGEILCSQGKISQEQCIMLNKMREKTRDKLGKLLVKHRILTKHELYAALQDQTKTIAVSTFSLASGEWSFKKCTPKIPQVQKFGIALHELIVEGCAQISDFSSYKRKFNLRSPVTLPIPESLGQMLTSNHIRFYIKITQCSSITTKEIYSILEIPEKEFWQQLIMLYLLNIIDFTEFRIDSKLHRDLDTLDELHEKLKTDSINHYQLLQLKDTASVSEVRDKYFSFTKKFNPEAISAPPDSKTEEKAEYVIEKAAEAYETLSDQEKKKAYDTGHHKKEEITAEPTSKETNPQRARHLYLKAHSFYEESRYYEAIRFMEEAIQLDSTRASYYMLLGLSQMRIPEYRPYAEKNLQMAAKMEPWNADPLFYLGQLYWAEHLVKKAERSFRKALEINMEHTLASKMISKIEKYLKKKSPFSLFSKK
ncbi:MAG: DnaJ domain-containing protein [Candidatus Aminicenantes bacterium]|nr:DnaJ domain-containing protein [Candidatus Aminicenantes bacterium]NIM80294.1 DnaJ domain-containing protein [Candidatus Aminicenantes bacterium]NIN19641.1 DnaJ domain-containing protein [Candidatus Aminicenantes bacterium]NIN43523.1 DnaJ domain-containing protein [Candidatus Aminicenantes bacterium]NIN86268.1 DnaJ domain-containing protein [Candidatus Aminicenantes bacterium]